jgi:hypothetical protein
VTAHGHSIPKRIAVVTAALTGAMLAVLIATGVLGGHAGAADLPPVAEQMRAFAKPPLAPGDVPAVVRQAEDRLANGHGSAMANQVRLLTSGVGKHQVSIYGIPTTGGAVCILVNEITYSATCVDSFDSSGGNVQWLSYYGEGTPPTVAGLAADTVTGVQVVAGGVARDAILRGNAFFWQSTDPALTDADVEALLARQSDGSVVRVNLHYG